jgi:cytochrome c-type biogenesis protein CcmH/NrfF
MWRRAKEVAIGAVLVALSLSTTLRAEDKTDRRADDLAEQIMSPFCPGKTLNQCTSANAAGWRADIRDWVREGVPSDEIRLRLEQRAGKSLSSVPSPEQAYWMPALTVLVAGLTLTLGWRRIRRQWVAPEPPPPAATVMDRWDEQLDDELAQLD